MRGIIMTLAVVASCLAAAPAAAQEEAQSTETAILTEMFEGGPLTADQFTPELLAQVPLEQLQAIVDQLKGLMGTPTGVRTVAPTRYVVVTETHEMAVQMVIGADTAITGIFFSPPVDLGASTESLLAGLSGGDASAYLVMKDGEVLHASNESEPLAVGSVFKLGILAVLNDQIAAGERAWADVVTLEEADRSLPTGTLQTFAAGAPLTLHTAAALMISASDNTATDILLRVAGRAAVQDKLGLERPPLSTREFFVLKANPALLARYNEGDATALEAAAGLPLPAAITEPHQQGAEWYLPLTTLCAMMDEVGGLDVMHINPGVAQPGDWDQVAFKGGSEIGVLNLTTRTIAEDGTDYCVSVTWNDDQALDEGALIAAYGAVLSALARE